LRQDGIVQQAIEIATKELVALSAGGQRRYSEKQAERCDEQAPDHLAPVSSLS
jgi:hypothetical protein